MLLKKKVILTTTTRCVALRLSSKASTVHNTFHIQCKGYVRPLQELSVEFQILKEADIIIIDEMSMMTSTLLQSVEIRLRQIENDTNEPYHSKLIILVGDHAQLPATCHCHLLDIKNYCQKHYVYNAIDWNFATYHTLETSIRHVENSKYCSFFNIIRCRAPTKEEISSILNNCYIEEDLVEQYIDDETTILCTHQKNVDYYHDLIIHKKFPTDQIYAIQLETNARNVEHIQSWVNNKRFNHMQHVALGALVMLTENIDLKVGVANGTTRIVTKLEFDLEDNVCSIFVALNPSGNVQIVQKKSIQNKYDSQGHFYKTSFPLMLGYAIIGHKSQGATISSKMMIHIRESFARGLVYVMLSRVTSRKNLKIVNNLQPSYIQPMLPWFLENVNIVVN
jgi:ATP-dependent exoDNAse (exonuclease V) alpha subunit